MDVFTDLDKFLAALHKRWPDACCNEGDPIDWYYMPGDIEPIAAFNREKGEGKIRLRRSAIQIDDDFCLKEIE